MPSSTGSKLPLVMITCDIRGNYTRLEIVMPLTYRDFKKLVVFWIQSSHFAVYPDKRAGLEV